MADMNYDLLENSARSMSGVRSDDILFSCAVSLKRIADVLEDAFNSSTREEFRRTIVTELGNIASSRGSGY